VSEGNDMWRAKSTRGENMPPAYHSTMDWILARPHAQGFPEMAVWSGTGRQVGAAATDVHVALLALNARASATPNALLLQRARNACSHASVLGARPFLLINRPKLGSGLPVSPPLTPARRAPAAAPFIIIINQPRLLRPRLPSTASHPLGRAPRRRGPARELAMAAVRVELYRPTRQLVLIVYGLHI